MLVTNKKSHTVFRLVPTWVTLNDLGRHILAVILLDFTEFDSLQAAYVTIVEDRPILSADYRLPLFTKTDPPFGVLASAP